MRKIGVFSGTFDPIHIAHVEDCLVATAALELDTVCILLEKKPVRKVDVTDYKDRLEMVKLATSEYRRINVLDFDENNVTVGSALNVLDSKFANAEYWYILGSDLLKYIENWQDFDKLIANFNLCVVLRKNSEKDAVVSNLKKISEKNPDLKIKILPEVWSEVSSSKIRDEINKTGTSKLIHPDVLNFIKDNILY